MLLYPQSLGEGAGAPWREQLGAECTAPPQGRKESWRGCPQLGRVVPTAATFPAKQYLNRRIWSRERFTEGPCWFISPKTQTPESLLTKDWRGWPFQHFKVSFESLACGVIGASEGEVQTPLKVCSQDANVIPQYDMDEKTTQSRRKRRKWQLLGDC